MIICRVLSGVNAVLRIQELHILILAEIALEFCNLGCGAREKAVFMYRRAKGVACKRVDGKIVTNASETDLFI